ncbi:DUF2155 domain-containing protein [Candidatus Pelagibacter sp.]|nr:DUF2155 domain-containing protein [Candidatus Pelagibacter sp.]
MPLKKNTKVGKINISINLLILIIFQILHISTVHANELEGNYTSLKVLDKISSKNILIKLKNNEDTRHKDLLIKSIKCKNSEFDDNPEITAYIQVKDLTKNNNDEVFVFNGWIFSSSPSMAPFDHPVYDIWLVGCN